MRFLVDEDLSTDIARIGRGLGLDIVSVHELARRGWTDEQQLVQAAVDGRCVVTGNRQDFTDLTTEFSSAGRPHAGVVIVQQPLRDAPPARIAHALARFVHNRGDHPTDYLLTFLSNVD